MFRGQGPQRGNYHRWPRWVQDINEFATLQKRGRQLPMTHVGQSLGSVLALAAAAENPPAALVLQSPALVLAQIATLNAARATGPAALELGKNSLMSHETDEIFWEQSPDLLCKGFSYRYLSALARRAPEELHAMFNSRDKGLRPHPDPKASHDLINDRVMREVTLKKTGAWLAQRMLPPR